MRNTVFAMAAAIASIAVAQAASAQDTGPSSTTTSPTSGTSFRGFRIEGDIGANRFQSEGVHDTKLGYGATIGFDGQIGDKIVVGPEVSLWRANNWTQNCTPGVIGGTVCHKSFQELDAAVRAGYLVTPSVLVFAKGGYSNNEQRKSFNAPIGQQSYYNHANADGYLAGGGVEYSLNNLPVPAYVNAQYVYAHYDDYTSTQRAMMGVGIRFK